MRDDAFFFASSQAAETVEQLRDALRTVEPSVSGSHVTAEKNDFANWVRHVHSDEELARRLEKCRSVYQVLQVLDERIDGPKRHAQFTRSQPLFSHRSEPATERHVTQPVAVHEPEPKHEAPEPFTVQHTDEPEPYTAQELHVEEPTPVAQEIPAREQPAEVPRSVPRFVPPIERSAGQAPEQPPGNKLSPTLKEFLIGFGAGAILGVIAWELVRAII